MRRTFFVWFPLDPNHSVGGYMSFVDHYTVNFTSWFVCVFVCVCVYIHTHKQLPDYTAAVMLDEFLEELKPSREGQTSSSTMHQKHLTSLTGIHFTINLLPITAE